MLELRPNCELCDGDLPPNSSDAMICSYECTYCADCVKDILQNVCPTCGGGFVQRPIRPVRAEGGQTNLGLSNRPAGTQRYHSAWSSEQIEAVVMHLKDIPPEER
ncbi:DUF1272 domain-containing protein [Octadecabacter sp. CECT 8868]|uniref:DUF1272 domain-containing protein n=1 Tax=Octadecabacter algicola TaxID=2909342 RepID=UPI001F36B8E2|nr:DUF1272 domain-containing protein [Octadecabacter algicola]MCF2905004.1 DUF1272 domain-containing protein [Octadecabacter algicola]